MDQGWPDLCSKCTKLNGDYCLQETEKKVDFHSVEENAHDNVFEFDMAGNTLYTVIIFF